MKDGHMEKKIKDKSQKEGTDEKKERSEKERERSEG